MRNHYYDYGRYMEVLWKCVEVNLSCFLLTLILRKRFHVTNLLHKHAVLRHVDELMSYKTASIKIIVQF